MWRFYFSLWLAWFLYLLLLTLGTTFLLASLVTFYTYVSKGAVVLDAVVIDALYAVFIFWFLLLLNFVLPIALFVSVKKLFNRCVNGFSLKLYACTKQEEYIEPIGFGDLIKVWRKWLLLIVWGSGAFTLLSFVVNFFLSGFTASFTFFSVYYLYGCIALSSFFAIPFLVRYCTLVGLRKC